MPDVSTSSPYYPYEKVQDGFNTLSGAERIPSQIIQYLLDLPLAGYTPTDNNSYPRVRLAKYLWYDGANPLRNTLPTPQQKLSLLFDGDNPVLNTPEQQEKHHKGYRVFPQRIWGQSTIEAGVILKCYMGRTIAKDDFNTTLGLVFEILVNVNLEGTTRTDAYSRAFDIEQCLIESLHGVNINGIGVIHLNRQNHGDDGSVPVSNDGTIVGRRLHMSVSWSDGDGGVIR